MQIKKSYLLLCSLLLLAVPYKIRAEELFDGTQGILSSEEISSGLTSFDPGDAVEVTYLRDGKQQTATLTLLNSKGNTQIIRQQ